MCYRRVRCCNDGSSHTLIRGGRVKEVVLKVAACYHSSDRGVETGPGLTNATARGSASHGCVAAAFCSVLREDRSPGPVYVVLVKHPPCPSE